MLRILDQKGKLKFVLRDEDEEPMEYERLILEDEEYDNEEEDDAKVPKK